MLCSEWLDGGYSMDQWMCMKQGIGLIEGTTVYAV